MAERSEARPVFCRSKTGIVVSNPTQGVDNFLSSRKKTFVNVYCGPPTHERN